MGTEGLRCYVRAVQDSLRGDGHASHLSPAEVDEVMRGYARKKSVFLTADRIRAVRELDGETHPPDFGLGR